MDDFDFPHWVRIRRPTAGDAGAVGGVDEGTGDWVPAGAGEPGGWAPMWEGPMDVQDRGAVVERDSAGRPTRTSDASIYGPSVANLGALRAGDVLNILFNPLNVDPRAGGFDWSALPDTADTADAQVVKAQRLDGRVMVEFL